jgi:CRISPR-associated exonuclease Cas4
MELKITPTELLEYYFCPRFIYFMDVLKIPQNEDRRYKVQKGKEIHEERQQHNKGYLWKKIGAVKRESDVYLLSEHYPLRGIVDEVVTLKDGSLAPVDYKFAVYPEFVYKSHKTQILCYCLLVEDVFDRKVNQGYIFYIRDGNRQVTLPFNEGSKRRIVEDINRVLGIIQNERMPKPTPVKSRCMDCTYKNICNR